MYDLRTRRFTLRLLGDAGENFDGIIKTKVSVKITKETPEDCRNEGEEFESKTSGLRVTKIKMKIWKWQANSNIIYRPLWYNIESKQ